MSVSSPEAVLDVGAFALKIHKLVKVHTYLY